MKKIISILFFTILSWMCVAQQTIIGDLLIVENDSLVKNDIDVIHYFDSVINKCKSDTCKLSAMHNSQIALQSLKAKNKLNYYALDYIKNSIAEKKSDELVRSFKAFEIMFYANLGFNKTSSGEYSESIKFYNKAIGAIKFLPPTIVAQSTKKKLRKAAYNLPKGTCKHCNYTCDVANLERWHNDNCKDKNDKPNNDKSSTTERKAPV